MDNKLFDLAAKRRSVRRYTNEPTPETKDEPTPETKDEPTHETKDEPTHETKDEPTPETKDEPDKPTEKGLLGDVNGDGQVDSADALLILRDSTGLEEFDELQSSLGDVDSDGEITSADALAVLRFSVGFTDNSRIGTEVEAGIAA